MSRLTTLATPVVSLVTAIYWLFFQCPPPKTSVDASLVWLLPIVLAVFAALTQLFLPSTKQSEVWTIDAVTLDLSRSAISATTILLTLWKGTFHLVRHYFNNNLSPLDTNNSESLQEWLITGFITCLLSIWILVFSAIVCFRPMLEWGNLGKLKNKAKLGAEKKEE